MELIIYFLIGSIFIAACLLIMFAIVYAMNYFVGGTGNRWIALLIAAICFAAFASMFGYLLLGLP